MSAFKIGDEVLVTETGADGIIEQVREGLRGTEYLVHYSTAVDTKESNKSIDLTSKSEWFTAEELKPDPLSTLERGI